MSSTNRKRNGEFMKNLLLVTALVAPLAVAGPYIEYKNNVSFTEFDTLGSFEETTGNLRLGTSIGKNFYVEYGKFGTGLDFDTGTAAEAGYKVKFGDLQIKGKIESTNVDDWNHKLETEVRYTFW
mgnify:CR=1 FL=1|tara:strand:+ start:185 stop:559 length:375 start_codon:yes stop_codon:yes gene_type:complete